MRRIPHPANGAYTAEVLERDCLHCGSPAWTVCYQDDGNPRSLPCITRLLNKEP